MQTVAAEPRVVLAQLHGSNGDAVPRAQMRDDGDGCYAVCECGWTTGYCDSLEQAATIALEHRCRTFGG